MADVLSMLMGYDRSLEGLGEPFKSFKKRVSLVSPSEHRPESVSGATTSALSPNLIKVLMKVARMKDGEEDVGALGKSGFVTVAEVVTKDGRQDLVLYDPDAGTVSAMDYDTESDTAVSYTMKKEERSGSSVLFALFPTLQEDKEFSELFDKFKASYDADFSDTEELSQILGKISDNVYFRIKNNDSSAHVNLELPSTGKLQPIKNTALLAGVYNPEEVICGEFTYFHPKGGISASPTKTADKKKGYSLEDLNGRFVFDDDRVLSEEEQAMVPRLEPWYIIPEFVMDICKTVRDSAFTTFAMKNFTLRGIAGSGKSQATHACAAGWNLPHVFFTCSSDTEIFDFIGQVMPASNKNASPEVKALLSKFEALGGISCKTIAKVYGLPSLDDVAFMPDEVYGELTGKDIDKKMSDSDKIALVYKTWHEYMSKKFDEVIDLVSTDDDNKFVYTETDFIKAVKNGYVVEIQEPNVIANPGVLVGLNGLLEEGTITLPTGEVISRHPDTVVFFTTNVTYQGCRAMNQSVIDRSNEVYDVDTPSDSVMVERVMSIVEYPDEEQVIEMVSVLNDTAKMLMEMGDDGGVCGMRSLLSWAMKAKITGKPYEAFETTVLNKCSDDKEVRDALKKRIDESSFRATRRTRKR